MQKKAENARLISKLMQKKGRKYIFNFEIHTKKDKNAKKKAKICFKIRKKLHMQKKSKK